MKASTHKLIKKVQEELNSSQDKVIARAMRLFYETIRSANRKYIIKESVNLKILLFFIFNLSTCLPLGNLIIAQNITNTLGTSGAFTIKNASTNYLTLYQSTGFLSLNRSLVLPNTSGSAIGVIYKDSDWFIHNYGYYNTFLGQGTGNFTMTGEYNTGLGAQTLISNTAGQSNTAVGFQSLSSNTTGSQNIAIGFQTLFSNTTGYNNSALGLNSLTSNNIGFNNTALGSFSLYTNSIGNYNTAMGSFSLYTNAGGNLNTALGYQSLYSNSIGGYNTAIGSQTLYSNITGFGNIALGHYVLYSNNSGTANIAVGNYAMMKNTTGNENIAMGQNSLVFNITGSQNTAIGNNSMYNNISGTRNTCLGRLSLAWNTTGFQNTAIGDSSLYNNNGNYNTALGFNAGSTITTGANLTCIGIDAAPTSSTAINQVTLGNGFVSSLRCNVTTITSLSDMRDKKNIKDLSLGLAFITKLKPRLFNWDKREWYDDNISNGSKMQESPTAGFIAQELDEAQTTENAEWLNLVLKDNPEKWEATPGNLLPIMVKAIQELKAENDELKKEVNDLKTVKEKLAELEQMVNGFVKVENANLTESK